jgi:DNA-binding transcriptional LysR family regulator
MFQWNDLKVFLAVASEGSTLAAARLLKVNQTTVQRRITELEAILGLRLVERCATGYRLTPAGQSVLESARRVAAAVREFESVCAETAHEYVLRLTCPEPIAERLTKSGFLDRFHARYPDLRVEFVLADHYVDLARGQADVAFRSGDTDGILVGRKVAESVWAIYASAAYLERHGAPATVAEIAGHAVVAFDAGMSGHRLSQWLTEIAPNAHVTARCGAVRQRSWPGLGRQVGDRDLCPANCPG